MLFKKYTLLYTCNIFQLFTLNNWNIESLSRVNRLYEKDFGRSESLSWLHIFVVKHRNVNQLDGALEERMKAVFDTCERLHTAPFITSLALIRMIKELMNILLRKLGRLKSENKGKNLL